jgi:membrane-bound serine protease (ClpP class)
MRRIRAFRVMAVVMIAMVVLLTFYNNAKAQEDTIYYIPVKGEVTPALSTFIANEMDRAYQDGATMVVLEISTLGGRVDSALKISDTILNSGLDTIAYVKDRAISAGVLITISAKRVAMAPGSSIGSAETIPYTEKNISFWTGELRKVAEVRGRDPEVVAAMADRDIEIPGLIEKGKLLNLTATKAEELGIADEVIESRDQLKQWLDMEDARVVEVHESYQIRLAKAITNQVFSTILLTLGIAGLVAEMFIAGFGLPGTLGVLSFGLFFAGNMLAGHAGWSTVILFVIGIILLLIELTIPGFGIPGVGGIISILASIFMASASAAQAVVSLSISLLLSIALIVVLAKYAPRSKYFDRLILSTQQKSEEGYVGTYDATSLKGSRGVAATPLRPSGTAMINDRRIDVVTLGEFIRAGERVEVVTVEGNRIVVKKID